MDDLPDDVLEQARRRLQSEHIENQAEEQGRRLARRLLIAFLLIGAVSVVFFVVLPQFGIALPAIVPILCCATIAVGAIMSFVGDFDARRQSAGLTDDPQSCDPGDPGRPIGCCPGPRPLRSFRRDNR